MRSDSVMHQVPDITLLDWDSRFFEKKIGSCILPTGVAMSEAILHQAAAGQYDCLYVWSELAPARQQLPPEVVHTYHGVQLHFTLDLHNIPPTDPHPDVHIHTTSNDPLYPLAVTAGAWSRFFLDTQFPHAKSLQLYHRWLDASAHGTMGDFIMRAGSVEEPKGLITLKKMDDTLHIGLLSVDAGYRRQHVASSLLQSAQAYALQHHCTRMTVITQEQNTTAAAFYRKHHFQITEIKHITHYWFS